MKFLPLLLLICAACAAQDRALPSNSCPIAVSVAGTDVPLQSGNHIVVWFTNQTSKRVARTQFKLFILDSFGYRYPASEMYYSAWETAPGAGGVIVRPAKEEERYFGSTWRNMRGVEVQVSRVYFSDGSEWQSDPDSCKRTFMNADFIRDMRQWNKEVRADWNRTHPDTPIPVGSLASWLDPKSDGWK